MIHKYYPDIIEMLDTPIGRRQLVRLHANESYEYHERNYDTHRITISPDGFIRIDIIYLLNPITEITFYDVFGDRIFNYGIHKIDGDYYAFEYRDGGNTVFSIGSDNPKQPHCRWSAPATDSGIRYVAKPCRTYAAASAKVSRWYAALHKEG